MYWHGMLTLGFFFLVSEGKPELGFKEFYAHERLTGYMESHGFVVTRHHLGIETAWKAEFSHGHHNGRIIGLQSEMDALPHLGHACGHNLIAITGVAIALGLQAAMQQHNISGKVILLGTPAEEHGGGKIKLLEKGAYKEMDVCLMAHPGPGAPDGTVIQPWIAVQNIDVEFFGRTAHAAYAPWEGQNALDAAFLAYSAVSVLRQQIKPTHRVQGVMSGNESETNVIPDYAKMRWAVRAPSWTELEVLRERVIACFEGAAKATSCKVKMTPGVGYKDCKQNDVLGAEFLRIAGSRYQMQATPSETVLQASSDFGDISYEIPSIQPVFTIPTEKNGSNHTPAFAESAKTPRAHAASIRTSKALAATGLRVLTDDEFWSKIASSRTSASSSKDLL
ncbi:hypothetical protein BDY19DRAFT_930672 [Irpex rosettiformis]|uniref:Uncharacterized protein n=1 Tax=Irpex rosettiformis TaxID=378272 RepID=A0ACB8UBX8_9APHY|nr:hypothetical protein BDY19DRAFT_930672 [Irpex rosettiformis]